MDIQLKKCYKSKIREIWLNKGITNGIKIKVVNLDKWKLKRSRIYDGVTLFGKYKILPERVKQYYLFVIKPIDDITKRNRIIKKLFGRKEDLPNQSLNITTVYNIFTFSSLITNINYLWD